MKRPQHARRASRGKAREVALSRQAGDTIRWATWQEPQRRGGDVRSAGSSSGYSFSWWPSRSMLRGPASAPLTRSRKLETRCSRAATGSSPATLTGARGVLRRRRCTCPERLERTGASPRSACSPTLRGCERRRRSAPRRARHRRRRGRRGRLRRRRSGRRLERQGHPRVLARRAFRRCRDRSRSARDATRLLSADRSATGTCAGRPVRAHRAVAAADGRREGRGRPARAPGADRGRARRRAPPAPRRRRRTHLPTGHALAVGPSRGGWLPRRLRPPAGRRRAGEADRPPPRTRSRRSPAACPRRPTSCVPTGTTGSPRRSGTRPTRRTSRRPRS